MRRRSARNRPAFSLVELLVVLGILIVLVLGGAGLGLAAVAATLSLLRIGS